MWKRRVSERGEGLEEASKTKPRDLMHLQPHKFYINEIILRNIQSIIQT